MNVPESLANKKFWMVVEITLKDQESMGKVKPLVAEVKKSTDKDEPGCLHYILLQDPKDPLKATVIEQYENAAALDQHRNTEAYKTLFADRSVFTSFDVKFLEELL